MNYIVLDMEWNQPFNAKVTVGGRVQLHGEIIQIGAVKLDESFALLDTFKIMITPKYYKKMHEYVAKITKITTEELQQGVPFVSAFYKFKEWCGSDFAFLTWGPDDVGILAENMTAYGIDTDWIADTYDVQMIFAHQIVKKKQQTSLTSAMEMMGEPAFEAHDALNDAISTAVVCRHLDMEKGIGEYETMWAYVPGENEGDVREYTSRRKFFSDGSFMHFACPECGMKASCINLVRQNGEKYICIGRCEKDHEFFVRFRIKKLDKRLYRVSRAIYEMDEEKLSFYLKKQEKGRRRQKNS